MTRTAFVQFVHDGTEYSYECRYEVEPTGLPINIEATLVAVGPDQAPPTSDEPYWGRVWRDFMAALIDADAEKYPEPDRDDVRCFGHESY